ncbi:MAG TPA: type II toxin-antitoxin system HicB family antitoxin [Thermodesulfobacteriota bacterium]|nr:type II toxin-antitoxin system HicB family antitoxin [Thermodesulfobacteriota bacterium]
MDGYGTNIVCKIVNLSKRQLDYWDRTHFIKPSISEASGYGSVRLYSFIDLIQLKVAKTLKDHGVSVQKMRKSLNFLKKHRPEIEKPMAELKFITDGESIFVLTSNKNVILDTLREGQFVFSIALGKIFEELNGELKSLAKEKKYSVYVKKQKYGVVLQPAIEGGYWVECPSLPGCASQGDSIEETLNMIKDAIAGHLEVLKEDEKLQAKKSKKAKVA